MIISVFLVQRKLNFRVILLKMLRSLIVLEKCCSMNLMKTVLIFAFTQTNAGVINCNRFCHNFALKNIVSIKREVHTHTYVEYRCDIWSCAPAIRLVQK